MKRKPTHWVVRQTWPTDKARFNSEEARDTCDDARETLSEILSERLGDLTDRFMNDHFMPPAERARMKGLMEDLEDASDKLLDAIAVEPDAEYSDVFGGVHYTISKEQS